MGKGGSYLRPLGEQMVENGEPALVLNLRRHLYAHCQIRRWGLVLRSARTALTNPAGGGGRGDKQAEWVGTVCHAYLLRQLILPGIESNFGERLGGRLMGGQRSQQTVKFQMKGWIGGQWREMIHRKQTGGDGAGRTEGITFAIVDSK